MVFSPNGFNGFTPPGFGDIPQDRYRDAVGLAGVTPQSNMPVNSGPPRAQPPAGLAGLSFAQGGSVPGYAAGGAIDEETGDVDNPMMNTMGARMQVDINAALGVVGDVLSYGRKLHGIGGGGEQQTAGRMPTVPGNQSESGIPRPQPMPGPLPPTNNPFGKRVEGEEPDGDEGGAIDVAGVMPSQPFSETPKPQPMPGPLPPTSNPFGKRAEAETEPDGDEGGAIPTDDEEVA